MTRVVVAAINEIVEMPSKKRPENVVLAWLFRLFTLLGSLLEGGRVTE